MKDDAIFIGSEFVYEAVEEIQANSSDYASQEGTICKCWTESQRSLYLLNMDEVQEQKPQLISKVSFPNANKDNILEDMSTAHSELFFDF